MGQTMTSHPVIGLRYGHHVTTYKRNSDVDVQNHRNELIAAAQLRERNLIRDSNEYVKRVRRTHKWVKEQNKLHSQMKIMSADNEKLGLRRLGPYKTVENSKVNKENIAMDDVHVNFGVKGRAFIDSDEHFKWQSLGVV